MKGSMEFFLAGHPPSPNTMVRWHWGRRARERKTWRDATVWAAREAMSRSTLPGRFVPVSVVVTFVYPVKRTRDRDNMVASLKPVLDGLVDARILKDDGPEHLPHLGVEEEVSDRRAGIYVKVIEA